MPKSTGNWKILKEIGKDFRQSHAVSKYCNVMDIYCDIFISCRYVYISWKSIIHTYMIYSINTYKYNTHWYFFSRSSPDQKPSLWDGVAVMSVDVLAQDSIPWRLDDDRVMAAEGRFLCQNPSFSGWDRFFWGVKCTWPMKSQWKCQYFHFFEVSQSDETSIL